MSRSKRVHRACDRVQRHIRAEIEADFREIEARYRNEIVQLHDGTKGKVFGPKPKPVYERVLPEIPKVRHGDADGLLEMALAHHAHIAEECRKGREAEREAKAALKERGVTFSREPNSIHSHAGGRFGSIEKSSPKGSGYLKESQPFTYTRDRPKASKPSAWRQRG